MKRRDMIGFLAGIPAYAVLADEIAAANELGPAGSLLDEDTGPVGTKVIFENDRVKVWEFYLDPGEAVPMHTHKLDYLFHVYQGGTLEVTYPKELATPAKQIELKTGEARFAKKGGRHMARNISQQRYVEILVELKD